MISGMVNLWSRHTRANRALDLIKSYADQGKEPPPELFQNLQVAVRNEQGGRTLGTYGWIPCFLFAGLAVAFTFMASRDSWDEGLIFVAIIMGALALGFLASMVSGRRNDGAAPK